MGDGVHARGRGEGVGQGGEKIGIVDHRLGLNPGIALGDFGAIRRLAQDVGHLGAGIARGDHELRQVRPEGDSLAETGG